MIDVEIPKIRPYGGVIPDKATQTEEEFANNIYPFHLFYNESFIVDTTAQSNALNAFATQANSLAAAVAIYESNARQSSTEASQSRDETLSFRNDAEIFRDEAQNIVDGIASVLPAGTLNNELISETTTWSSSKIDSEITTRADSAFLDKTTPTPTLSVTDVTVAEHDNFTATITDFDQNKKYFFTCNKGSVDYVQGSDTFTYYAYDITSGMDESVTLTCKATRDGEIGSIPAVVNITVAYVPIGDDDAVIDTSPIANATSNDGFVTDGDELVAIKNNAILLSGAAEQEAGEKANATITFATNPSDGSNINLNGTIFTFRDSPVSANDVQIGASIEASIDNLLLEALPPEASYTKVGVDSVYIEYTAIGTSGNSYTIESNFLSTPANLEGGHDTPDGDWVENKPTTNGHIELLCKGKEIKIEPTSTNTALVSQTPIAQGEEVYLQNDVDGGVKGTLGTTTTTTGSTNIHDIFRDGSPVATYPLDGNANDLGGNYNGTAINVTYGAGKFGQCAIFNGSSSIINTPLPSLDIFTISGWVYRHQSEPTRTLIGNMGLSSFSVGGGMGFGISGGASPAYIDYADETYPAGVAIVNGKAKDSFIIQTAKTSGVAVEFDSPVGQWVHYCATYDGNTLKIYVNNTLKVSHSISVSSIPTYRNISIGGVNSNIYTSQYHAYTNSKYEQIRIIGGRAFTQSEVNTLYTEQATKYISDISSFALTQTPTAAQKANHVRFSTAVANSLAELDSATLSLHVPTGESFDGTYQRKMFDYKEQRGRAIRYQIEADEMDRVVALVRLDMRKEL